MTSQFNELLSAFAREVAREVVKELRSGEQPNMVDQSASPLGRRRHIAAVRRLVAEGKPGAAIVGRRHLLSRDALDTALTKRKPAKAPKAGPVDELAELRSRYGLERKAS